jgi:hypothetical protein
LERHTGQAFSTSDEAFLALYETLYQATEQNEHLSDELALAILGEEKIRRLREGVQALRGGSPLLFRKRPYG